MQALCMIDIIVSTVFSTQQPIWSVISQCISELGAR